MGVSSGRPLGGGRGDGSPVLLIMGAIHPGANDPLCKAVFEGRIKGLGPVVYQWPVMRQGVDTVKPDVGKLNDHDGIELTTRAAARIGVRAFELDWRIWEASRGGALPYPSAPG